MKPEDNENRDAPGCWVQRFVRPDEPSPLDKALKVAIVVWSICGLAKLAVVIKQLIELLK